MLQSKLDKLFKQLVAGLIPRGAYTDAIDSVPADLLRGLRFRRDERAAGEFALHLYDMTARERSLMAGWASLMGAYDLTYEDHGIANDGRLVLDPGGGNRRPDFLVRSRRGVRFVEVKLTPTPRFCTYKVADLENYLRGGDTLVLTFVGDRDRPDWFLLDGAGMRGVLARGERGRHRGFGGKPTVRIYRPDFPELRGWRKAKRCHS